MAVETLDQYQQKTVITKVLGVQLCIEAPAFFIKLANATLNGWHFVEQSELSARDIVVSYQDKRLQVDATILDKPKVIDDLLDALNEFFLCLSYLLANKNTNLKLLHCASYVEADQNVILLGEKKSGKSEYVLSKAIAGHKIYADDLLLWQPKKSEFIALGLPLRVRRSTTSLANDSAAKDKFLAGKNILYSHKKFFNQAELGEGFLLDQVKLMKDGFIAVNVPIYQFQKQLERHLISDNFISYKKPLKAN